MGQIRERKKSARSFSDRSFFMDVRAGCSCQNASFFQDLEGLTEVFGRMSAGISAPKLLLWADFSFLINSVVRLLGVGGRLKEFFYRGKVLIVSWTPLGMFLAGPPTRPRKRTLKESGISPEKDKSGRTSPNWQSSPQFRTPPFTGP